VSHLKTYYFNRSYFSLFSFLYFFTVPISLSDAQNSQLTTLRRRENAKFCGFGKKKKKKNFKTHTLKNFKKKKNNKK
jgi:hypothetical protein